MKFKSNIEIQAGLEDSSGSPGTVNQLLSSTVTGTAWIDPSTITAEAATLVVIACKNTSGAVIAQGTPVYQTGTVGATATIEIAPADALISENKLPAIGLLQTALNNNGFGFVVITGELTNFTTSPIDGVVPTTGDKVFVKSGGGLTLTKPTGEGNGIQNMGLVGKVSGGNSGSITVSSIMRTNDVPNLPTGRIWIGDGNTIVSDTVYVDEPNLRLGVGTTDPKSKLHISSSNSTDTPTAGTTNGGLFISNASKTYGLNLGVQNTGKSWIQGQRMDGNTALYDLLLQPLGGNVGINESNPSAKLEVDGTINFNSSGDHGFLLNSEFGTFSLGDKDGVGYENWIESLNGNIDIYNGGSLTFRADVNNRVGIGTDSPQAKLTVSDSTNSIIRINNTKNANWTVDEKLGSLEFYGNDASGGGAGVKASIVALSPTTYGAAFDMAFQTNDGAVGGSEVEHMRIKFDGKVGIGTNSPSHELTVQGSSSPNIELKNTNYSDGGFVLNRSNYGQQWKWWAQSGLMYFGYSTDEINYTNHLTIKSNGYIGVGETNPQSLLHISDNTGLGFTMERTGGAPSTYTVENSGDRINHNYVGGSNGYRWQVEGTMRLELLENGSLYLNGSTALKVGGGSWGYYSDERVKKDVSNYTKGLDEILSINPVTYKYNGKANIESEKEFVGIIAQEIKEVLPSTIEVTPAKLNDEDEFDTDLLTFDASELTFTLINAVKELKAEIEELKKQINK